MFLNKINSFVLNPLAKVSRLLFLICLSFLFMLSACGDSSTDTDMDPIDNGGGGGGGGIGTAPTFNNVGQLFLAQCGDCHTSQQESGVRLNSYSNAMESMGEQYQILVIQPGDADGSPLVDKIESSNPEHGVRMPQGGSFLSTERINQIKAWIDDGAENN